MDRRRPGAAAGTGRRGHRSGAAAQVLACRDDRAKAAGPPTAGPLPNQAGHAGWPSTGRPCAVRPGWRSGRAARAQGTAPRHPGGAAGWCVSWADFPPFLWKPSRQPVVRQRLQTPVEDDSVDQFRGAADASGDHPPHQRGYRRAFLAQSLFLVTGTVTRAETTSTKTSAVHNCLSDADPGWDALIGPATSSAQAWRKNGPLRSRVRRSRAAQELCR